MEEVKFDEEVWNSLDNFVCLEDLIHTWGSARRQHLWQQDCSGAAQGWGMWGLETPHFWETWSMPLIFFTNYDFPREHAPYPISLQLLTRSRSAPISEHVPQPLLLMWSCFQNFNLFLTHAQHLWRHKFCDLGTKNVSENCQKDFLCLHWVCNDVAATFNVSSFCWGLSQLFISAAGTSWSRQP